MLKKLWRLILRLFNFKDEGAKVPQGLEVRDSNGNITLGADDRVSVFVARTYFSDKNKSATITHELFTTNTPFFVLLLSTRGADGLQVKNIRTALSGSSYTISADTAGAGEAELLIGAY